MPVYLETLQNNWNVSRNREHDWKLLVTLVSKSPRRTFKIERRKGEINLKKVYKNLDISPTFRRK